jgi:hypothetical protein
MSKIDANLDEHGTKALDLDGTAINLQADTAVTGDMTVSGDLTVTGAVGGALEAVADPGDAGTITPPTSGADFSCAITTAGAETRILGTPARLGQRAVVVLAVDGGDLVMSNAGGWIDGADNTLTFGDALDAVTFEAVGVAAVTDWRQVSKKGVALTTV